MNLPNDPQRPRRLLDRLRGERGMAILLALMMMSVMAMVGINAVRSSNFDMRVAGAMRDSSQALQRARTACSNIGWDFAKLTNMSGPETPVEPEFSVCQGGDCSAGDVTWRATARFAGTYAGDCSGEGSSEQYFKSVNWRVECSGYSGTGADGSASVMMTGSVHALVKADATR